ncbi:hypothetical protein QA633_43635 [Bradyrhizobium barranii]|uniref:hypothetical protein n=1 Tax=Bradyrhizobium barranii TaxID=2992140 RepID=UPI0024AEC57B|nr:hypothetical protein [Bradyrhizobium barranii]WFT95066.1 hypothetical protein QA633_43635 [Bradyrhizobium barranii]
MKKPFWKPSEIDKRSAAFQPELAAARRKVSELDAGKAAALADSVAFGKWSAERSAASLEVDRLTGLIETYETDAEAARRADAEAAARRETAAARKAAADLANRIRTDGARIMTELLQLTQDCAKQSLAAKALNSRLPDGEVPVPAADILARDFGAEDRKDLRSRETTLWVVADDGRIVGDQASVNSADGVTGHLHVAGAGFRWKCVRRKFREVEFHPRTLPDWPGGLFQLMRLPRVDGLGYLFDGATMTPEAVADLDVAAVVAPRKKQRPTQIELVPVDPAWPPADVVGQADRNAGL